MIDFRALAPSRRLSCPCVKGRMWMFSSRSSCVELGAASLKDRASACLFSGLPSSRKRSSPASSCALWAGSSFPTWERPRAPLSLCVHLWEVQRVRLRTEDGGRVMRPVRALAAAGRAAPGPGHTGCSWRPWPSAACSCASAAPQWVHGRFLKILAYHSLNTRRFHKKLHFCLCLEHQRLPQPRTHISVWPLLAGAGRPFLPQHPSPQPQPSLLQAP